jgi:hypothetical protein
METTWNTENVVSKYLSRHGFGRWVNPNGDCYEGTFVYDARHHGSGTYTWKNGNVYRGDFFEDKRQGKVRVVDEGR